MINSTVVKKTSFKTQIFLTISAITIAVLLPQVFHAVGAVSGLGASLGAAFLPMHLSVLLAGLLGGVFAGLTAGFLSPLLSFAISGMPTVVLLPFMTIELAAYGLVCGLLKNKKLPMVAKILIAQISGRIVRALAIVIAVYGFNFSGISIDQTWSVILSGLPGILLQLVVVPLLMFRINVRKERRQ